MVLDLDGWVSVLISGVSLSGVVMRPGVKYPTPGGVSVLISSVSLSRVSMRPGVEYPTPGRVSVLISGISLSRVSMGSGVEYPTPGGVAAYISVIVLYLRNLETYPRTNQALPTQAALRSLYVSCESAQYSAHPLKAHWN